MHDFSQIGVPKAPPATRPSARPPRFGIDRRRSIVTVVVVVVVVAALAAAVYALTIGRGSSGGSADPRYCRLSTQLDSYLAGAGMSPTNPVPASIGPDSVKRVLTQMGDQIGQLAAVAPAKVRPDVGTVVTALRQAAAGRMELLRAPGFVKAQRSLARFMLTNPCRAGA